jgi:hypothetical protein
MCIHLRDRRRGAQYEQEAEERFFHIGTDPIIDTGSTRRFLHFLK